MSIRPGISSYQEMQLKTADPGKLILMLYERLSQELDRAKELINKKDYIGKSEAILKSQNIIMELISSLDLSTGQIAQNLQALYFFAFRELNLINLHKDVNKLEKIIQIMANLKSAWEEIVIKNTRTINQTEAPVERPEIMSIVE